MSDYDEDVEAPEVETSTESLQETVTLADLKKARNEAKNLRDRLKEAQNQVLTTRFSEDVLKLIPEEVTDFERRVALAEQYAALFPSGQKETPTEVATDAPAQEVETPEAEAALAAVAKGPSGGGSIGLTQDELLQKATADPAWYAEARKSGLRLEGLPGKD